MALNSGFDRFEGSAYFGYDMEGDGYEAVVIIGENLIEIRDTADRTLSQWIPGTYTCNEQELPLRAYFHRGEWLAPQDEELREALDQFVAPADANEMEGSRKRSLIWLWLFIAIIALALLLYFSLAPLTNQLLSTSIREALDEKLVASLESEYEICNPSLNQVTHDKVIGQTGGKDFIVFPTMNQNYARLPSGALAINAEFLLNLGHVDTLASLLQLADKSNHDSDAAADIISKLPLTKRFSFLANAEVDNDVLNQAWQTYAQEELMDVSLYKSIDAPKGNFQDLSAKIGWAEGEYPSEPIGLPLTDQEWLSLFTFCLKE